MTLPLEGVLCCPEATGLADVWGIEATDGVTGSGIFIGTGTCKTNRLGFTFFPESLSVDKISLLTLGESALICFTIKGLGFISPSK